MRVMIKAAPSGKRSRELARARMAFLGALCLGTACGGSAPAASTGTSDGPSPCPAGQRFDGEYCIPSGEVIPEPSDSGSGGAPATGGVLGAGGSGEENPAAGGRPVLEPSPSGGAPAVKEPRQLAAPVDITMAAAAGPMVQYAASTHLPAGARPFGVPFAGQFQEGQMLLQRLQLTPGACYTVVAFGPPPIEDLRLGFYAVDATQPHAVAEEPLLEETDRGNQAVLGRKEQCFKPTEDQRDVWLVIIAEAGRGVAAAQIFQKDR